MEFHLFTAGEKDDHLVVFFKLQEKQENCTCPFPQTSPNSLIIIRSMWLPHLEIRLSGKGLWSLTPNAETTKEV